jgi:predicted CXXCH cytochrome family protein
MTFAMKIGRVLAAIMLVGVFSSTLTGCSSETEAQAVPGSAKSDKLTQCVRPKSYMRRNHMELIKHQRDITVHQGIRATKDSLAGCIACHVKHDAAGEPIPVNAKGQFCSRCHEYLAVQPDCFGCHSTVPEGPQPANLEQQWPEVFANPTVETTEPIPAPAEQPVAMEPTPVATTPAEPTEQPAAEHTPVAAAPAEPTEQPTVEPAPTVEPVAQPVPVEQTGQDGGH